MPVDPTYARLSWRGLLRLVLAAGTDLRTRVILTARFNWKLWIPAAVITSAYRTATRGWQRLVVVTGSLGKTTTTRALLAAVHGQTPGWAHEADNCFALIGVNLIRQTPWARVTVVEVGIGSPGQMAPYARMLRPHITVMTSLASDHGRKLGGPQGIWNEKVRMIRILPRDGVAVLNGDDAAVMRMASETQARVVTFGFSPFNDVHGSELRVDATGTSFRLCASGRSWPVRSRLVGRDAVRALVAAAAAGQAAGMDVASLVPHLENVLPTPGRMQPFSLSCGAVILSDDFKGGFETAHAALEVLREIKAERRVVVLGELFEPQSPRVTRYEDVGTHAASVVDRILLLGKWSRLYLRGIANALPAEAVTPVRSVEEAAEVLRNEIRSGDVVLLKGRGEHKLSRIALALSDVRVKCRLHHCSLENVRCETCPQLGIPTSTLPQEHQFP